MGAGRVQAPLEHVAFDDGGARDHSLLLTLGGRADIDEQAALGNHGCGLVGVQPLQPGPGLVEELVDGGGHLAAPSGPAEAWPADPNRNGRPGGE